MTAHSSQAFAATWDSLQTYRCPDWFRDAKFGIWAHWGPQAVPMVGDWYARHLYVEGHPQHAHHVRTYGHPSRFGYKEIVRQWKAERFDPERLLELYKRAGARYFVACAVHHDNFDCWNSRHHAWNSVNVGPGKDIVGLWEKATRAAGLRFGVTEHLERSWSWFNTNKGADAAGPWAGVPYDGNDPAYADFYFPPHADTSPHYPDAPPAAWPRQWQARILDLIDQYDPDLLYTDGGVPFGPVGLEMVAHFYNRNLARRGGRLEAVYTIKDPAMHTGNHGEYREGMALLDVERGVVVGIRPIPWQTDTCVGGWYYDTRQVYKSPQEVIQILVDVVSKNGCLLLNLPPRPDGTLDQEEEWIAQEIGRWLDVNGAAIYGTRPWRAFGEGPTRLASGSFAEREKRAFTPADFRFTQRGDAIYAVALAWPSAGEWVIGSLAGQPVRRVTLLGHAGELAWQQDAAGLRVSAPATRPCDHAYVLKVE